MKRTLLATALTVCLCAGLGTTARAAVTAPVGYVKLTFNAQSDTPFSLPLNRPKASSGKVASIAGNVITTTASNFTASEFVYADGSQNEHYYLLFTTGVLEGRSFDITANSTNTITVDQDGDTNIQALINDANATDTFEIRPHWTLNTLFPDGANFAKSTNFFSPSGLILLRNLTTIGTDIPATTSYLYFDSSTNSEDGWYDAGNPGAGKQDDLVLKNSTFYIYRNKTGSTETLNLSGDVPMTDGSVKINILSDFIKQDNYIAFAFPVEVTLNSSGLSSSTSFKKTTNFFAVDGDRILVYPDTASAFDQPAITSYIYFDSSDNTQDGWYDAGNAGAGKQGDIFKFKPGKGYVIRKAGESAEKFVWKPAIPYNPTAE